MRGLTEEEYAGLLFASGDLDNDNADDSSMRLDRRLENRRCVKIVNVEIEVDEDGDWYGQWDTNITPLGRLALSLWPAIRVTR